MVHSLVGFELGSPNPVVGRNGDCFAGKESASAKGTSGKATDFESLIRSVCPGEQNGFVGAGFPARDSAGQGLPLFADQLVWHGHGRYRVMQEVGETTLVYLVQIKGSLLLLLGFNILQRELT